MNPAPSLHALIESVEADASSDDPLDRLSQASSTAADLEQVSDALLGHFVDQSRRSGRSWTQISAALGVTRQAAHKRFSITAVNFEPDSPTFERFTPRAKAVVRGAAEQARLRARAEVTSEDILLALFEPAQGVAAQVLLGAGISRAACEQHLGSETAVTGPAKGAEAGGTDAADADSIDTPPFTEQAKSVLKTAVEEALRLRHNYIGTEHLLLGIYYDAEDPAAKTLADLGLDYADAKDRLTKKLDELT
jgi:ATP-dependent Clp protease ATP-binding subunit ClpA